jgi:hypothetical protein
MMALREARPEDFLKLNRWTNACRTPLVFAAGVVSRLEHRQDHGGPLPGIEERMNCDDIHDHLGCGPTDASTICHLHSERLQQRPGLPEYSLHVNDGFRLGYDVDPVQRIVTIRKAGMEWYPH